nr:hypothetical protein [Tanacetum cinerariifolium]
MLMGTCVHHPTVHILRGYTINRANGNYSCLHSFQTKPPFTHLQPPTLLTATELHHQEYLLEFTSEYGISEALHPELPGPEERIVDFLEGKQEAEEKYPSMLYQAIGFRKKLKQLLLLGGREGIPDYCRLAHKCSEGWDASLEYLFPEGCDDIEHTSHPNLEITRSTTLLSRVEPQILPGRRGVKTGTRPRAAYEVPLFTVTASRVIEMEDPAAATDSSGVPSTIERSPLDFANENLSQQSTGPKDQGQEAVAPKVPSLENVTTTGVAPKAGQAEGIAATGPHVVKERRKRGNDGIDTNTPPKILRRDHDDARPTESTHGGKSFAAIGLGMGSTRIVPASQGVPVDMSDPDPLSFADPQLRPTADVTQSSKGAAVAGDLKLENSSFTSMVGSPETIYRPEWGITNGCLLDAPEACQDLMDHIAPPRYFLELRHLHNDDFLKLYNVNLARQAKENEIKNLETPLEAETDMKKAAEGKSAELSKELETCGHFFRSPTVFEEFKQYEDNRVEQRCAKMDARLDALSIDFDEELYPHMLTAIAGRMWVIEHGLRLAVMKCDESTELRQAFADIVSAGVAKGMSEGLKHGVEHEKTNLSLEAIEAYDLEAEAKYIAALHALKDLSSSQLTIPVYPEARDPTDPWACKEEILLADAIAANVSRAEKKKKCRVVCRTHVVGFAHHARSDGVSVSVPTVGPQGIAILLADAATQIALSKDEASPRLLRSSSLSVMHN